MIPCAPLGMTVIVALVAVAFCEKQNSSCLLQVRSTSSSSHTETPEEHRGPTWDESLLEGNSTVVGSGQSTSPERRRGCIYVGILSGPNNTQKRKVLREKLLKRLANQSQDDAHQVIAEFVIGHGDFATASQGAKPTNETLHMERALVQERATHGDIRRIPLKDDYKTLTDKVLQILEIGVKRECSLIVKLDDDRALNVDLAKEIAKPLTRNSLLYTGINLWTKPAYDAQAGADGEFAQYFGGPAYALSYGLASLILQDSNFANEFLSYGSKSEDVDMGRWVHAQDKPPGTVHYLENRQFATFADA